VAERQQCDEHVARAIDAVVRRHYGDAGREASLALELDPRAARARAVLGMVLLQSAAEQDPPELFAQRSGELEIERARLLAPDDAIVGWLRAVFLAETGHITAAAAAAEEALAQSDGASPAERAALLGVAGTYRYELGEERAALPHLQEYVALRSDDATAFFRLGACHSTRAALPQGIATASLQAARRDAEAAARAFARCFELAPGDEDAALAVSAALLRAAELADQLADGQGDDATRAEHRRVAAEHRRAAAEHLNGLDERFPDSAEPRFRLGVIAAADGQSERARAAYAAGLERDPRHAGCLMNLAASTAAAGDDDAARVLLRRLLAVDDERSVLSRDERRRIESWLRGPDQPSAAGTEART
jgi:tetratricopeptide (TPR) repeat protein